jgi:hypothetical protein
MEEEGTDRTERDVWTVEKTRLARNGSFGKKRPGGKYGEMKR